VRGVHGDPRRPLRGRLLHPEQPAAPEAPVTKSDALIGFYARLGFASLPDEPRRLVYPMRKIEKLFNEPR